MNDSASLFENSTAPLAPPVAPASSRGGTKRVPTFCERLVLSVLEEMSAGQLRLELPSGEVRHFGKEAEGVRAEIRVRREVFFQKCVLFGDIGLGESYVDGDWETDSLERVISWFLANVEQVPGASGAKRRRWGVNVLQLGNKLQHWLRPNSLQTCRRNIAEHYDLGNDFYGLWLDSTMTYSSGIFTAREQSLESAQTEKYDRLCRELRLQPGDEVLEIGCGWAGFSTYAARHYGCHVTGITISEAQHAFGQARVAREGLGDHVEIRLQDYRLVQGKFDKIVSIEMMEALGERYLPTFCTQLHRLLKPRGLIGLQFITVPDSRHADLRRGVDFIQKHIFPGSLLLSLGRVNEMLADTGEFVLHDLRDLGASYARTLHCWWERFNARFPEIAALGFDERFRRKWNYYLQYCEAAFASRNISVVHAIYTRPNNPLLHETFAA